MASSKVATVYAPSALLVLGAAVLKKEWLPVAIAVAAAVTVGAQFLGGAGGSRT